ncbi:MAG TPA: hypothetical protein DDZ41_07915 [Flavobacterium sp.]|nr:hypothetical protein [Flavobacterium sp.]
MQVLLLIKNNFMKKTLLILFCGFLFLNCSNDNDSSTSSSTSLVFNPPSWIQGRWLDKNLNFMGYRFTGNDFALITGSSEVSIGKEIKWLNDAGGTATINEEIKTSVEYKFSYTIQSVTQYFHFVKVTNTEIKDQLNDPDGYNLFEKK